MINLKEKDKKVEDKEKDIDEVEEIEEEDEDNLELYENLFFQPTKDEQEEAVELAKFYAEF